MSIFKYYFEDKGVLGKPPYFNKLADPSGRNFVRNLALNAPIVSITPGIPDYSSLTDNEQTKEVVEEMRRIEEDAKRQDGGVGEQERINKIDALLSKIKADADGDNRYFSFKSQPYEYMRILNTMLTRMHSRLDTGVALAPLPDLTGWSNLNMYCTAKSSISESGSNEYGSSMLENTTNTVSSIFNELTNAFNGAFGDAPASGVDSTVKSTADSMNNGAASAIISGQKLLLPKIWKGSSFQKSYTLSFKFETPYGDDLSIFTEVFTPFLALLALSLPRQSGMSSFKYPFLIRVESPGWFNIDCGAIESITIRRSPEEADWSKNGLSKKIEVDLSVTDLYPALMLSYAKVTLSDNIGLSEYLDSIAGLNARESKHPSLKNRIINSVNAGTGAASAAITGISSTISEAASRYSGDVIAF